jgi:hypothetical protein
MAKPLSEAIRRLGIATQDRQTVQQTVQQTVRLNRPSVSGCGRAPLRRMCVDHPHTLLACFSFRAIGARSRDATPKRRVPTSSVAHTEAHTEASGPDVSFLQAKHRAPKLESYLRGLDNGTRAALLRELQGTLRELYSHVLRVFGV